MRSKIQQTSGARNIELPRNVMLAKEGFQNWTLEGFCIVWKDEVCHSSFSNKPL